MGVATSNLITLDRARSQYPALTDLDDTTLGALVTAASGIVETYCQRHFAQATYDELLDGTGTPYMFVSNPPIIKVNSVRSGLMPAMYVQNNDSTNQTQAATVDVTSTGVTLSRMYNNTTTTTTFTFATYPTFTTLAAAINALGNGWTATVPSNFALWQTSDLSATEGSYSCRNITAPLPVYWWSLNYFRVNEAYGEIYSPSGFVNGYQAYRVTYLGGYDEIPEDLQSVTAQLVQLLYLTKGSNPLMNSETLDRYSYTKNAETTIGNLGVAARLTLNSYRLIRVARFK